MGRDYGLMKDIDLRKELADMIKETKYEVLVQRTSKKINCDCYNKKYKESESKCPKCIGTGYLFRFERRKCFKQDALSASSSQIAFSDIGILSNGYHAMFFEYNTPLNENDYVWEVGWMKQRPIKLMNLYKITSIREYRSETGSVAFKVAIVKKEVIDKDFKNMYIGKAWRDLSE